MLLLRGLAENVQAVANLCLFQFAKVGIQFAQITFIVTSETCVFSQPRNIREAQDFLLQMCDPARIDPGGFIILIDQCFEIAQRAVAFCAGQRRGKVVDNDC